MAGILTPSYIADEDVDLVLSRLPGGYQGPYRSQYEPKTVLTASMV